MSHNVSLVNVDGDPCRVQSHQEGGIIALGGHCFADMTVTYNYSKHFYVKTIKDRVAKDTIDELRTAVEKLGTKTDNDYWACTEGNVGHMCNVLLGWALEHPDAVWRMT